MLLECLYCWWSAVLVGLEASQPNPSYNNVPIYFYYIYILRYRIYIGRKLEKFSFIFY